jgi:hypothetical protein
MAALLTAAACFPRIALRFPQPERAGFLTAAMLWSAFCLWAFVFAWHERYSGGQIFPKRVSPRLWAVASACGLAGAFVLHHHLDPALRPLTPEDYPTNAATWVAFSLFSVVFEPVFLCFAPFAVLVRLTQKPGPAMIGTVLFSVLVMFLKINSARVVPPVEIILALLLLRVGSGLLSVYFYWQGGAPLVWLWVFLLQLHNLDALLV